MANKVGADSVPVPFFSFQDHHSVDQILISAHKTVVALLKEEVNKTHDFGTDLIVEAAEKTAHFISSLQASLPLAARKKLFANSDNLSMACLKLLQGLIHDIERKDSAYFQANPIDQRIRDLKLSSFLSNAWVPHVKGITPRFMATVRPYETIPIKIEGDFLYAQYKDSPSFIESSPIDAVCLQPSTKELQFHVDFNGSIQPDPDRITYYPLKLVVHWKDCWLHWTTSQITVLIGVLPASLGQIKVFYAKKNSQETEDPIPGIKMACGSKHSLEPAQKPREVRFTTFNGYETALPDFKGLQRFAPHPLVRSNWLTHAVRYEIEMVGAKEINHYTAEELTKNLKWQPSA